MGDPVIHFEIGGTDAERSSDFYTRLFGWHAESDGSGYVVVHTENDSGIGGGIVRVPEGVPPWATFYVGVEDLADALARAERLGARRIVGPTPVGVVGSFATITDPDGNMIGLFEEAVEEAAQDVTPSPPTEEAGSRELDRVHS